MFKQKDERKTTWMHLRSRHWHMIDFIITRCRDKMDIHSTRAMRGAYKDACSLLQKRTRALKSDLWERKAVELQRTADINDTRGFYNAKEVWGPRKMGPVHLKSTDGMDSKRVVARWNEHFQKLLNVPGEIDHKALDNIPQRITKTSLDEIPTMAEMARAIAGPKDGKAPGGDGIPAEVWKQEETICSADCTN
ncbi:hypothetical protein NP493_315g03025 [Ridgeia piscesae]|uniref:Uncharacterized protein n=1 Tax=Ridgeia piscesae TaxID=27915 RepID=A0AAD9L5M4_RIDPI|nr:hypothetical protein NP493_315g03025 [Ridgeia piscesae]